MTEVHQQTGDNQLFVHKVLKNWIQNLGSQTNPAVSGFQPSASAYKFNALTKDHATSFVNAIIFLICSLR